MDSPQLRQENNLLFKQILNRKYFTPMKEGRRRPHIELFLSASCPSNCSYCYLKKHQNELYPLACDNHELIVKNTASFLDYYIQEEFRATLEIFSAECIGNNLMFDIWDLIYTKFSVVDPFFRPDNILIADNFDFINSEELTNKVQSYIDKFEAMGIRLSLSASIDGKYMDVNRNKEHADEYYKKLFDFCIKNNYLVHPMISANNIELWKENYLWYMENAPEHIVWRLGALEVRDDNWTDDKLEAYSDFLRFVINYELEHHHNNDLISFTHRVFGANDIARTYDVLYIPWRDEDNHAKLGCSAQKNFVVRMGDLAIVRCHRTSYEDFVGGYFITDDNGKIIDIEAKNIAYYLGTLAWTYMNAPQCSDCLYRKICMGPCIGSNYESTNSSFLTAPSVCSMLKIKNLTLLMEYEHMGILDIAKTINKIHPDRVKACEEVLEFYKKGLTTHGFGTPVR